MKLLLGAFLIFSTSSVLAFSSDCPSDDQMFVFRNGSLTEASSGDAIEMHSTQVIDVLSTQTEPCVSVGGSVVDVEITTQLIQVNHSFMGVPTKTQFVCPNVELKKAQCGE